MYKITRKTTEKPMQFMLGDTVVEFKLPNETAVARFKELQGELAALHQQKDDPAIVEKIGECIIKLMRLFFGDEVTETMLVFFDGNYVEMIEQMFPYINKVIIPEIKKRSKARAKAMKRRK